MLQFKNKKLAERLEQRQACEDELRERIEKLEKRQATDDATLLIVNRYWAQVAAPLLPKTRPPSSCPSSDCSPGKPASCWAAPEGVLTFLVLSPFSWMKLWKPFSDTMRARGSCLEGQRRLGPRRGRRVMRPLSQSQGRRT